MQIKRRRSRSARVSVWLIGLAVVPLVGAGWFASGELDAVGEARRQASAVQRDADELVLVTQLQSAILDEGTFAAIVNGVTALGIDNEVVVDLLGINPEAELATATEQVDGLLQQLELDTITDELTSARRPPEGLTAIKTSDAYEAVNAAVGHRTEDLLERLQHTAGATHEAADVIGTLQILQDAAVAREAVGHLLLGQFGVLFAEPSDAMRDLEELIQSVDRYDDANEDILDHASAGESVVRRLTAIRMSEAYRFQRQEIEGVIESSLAAGGVDPDPTMSTILLDMEGIAQKYRTGVELTDAHLGLVVAAGEDVAAAAEALDRSADARTRRAGTMIAVLVLTTLTFAFAVAAVIGRPLRHLADSVRRLSTGDQAAKLRITGPTEIREASHALNEAVDNLAWAERQAYALAAGRLEDPALSEPSPGAFGASLQQAVATLTSSLAEREEFRRRLSHEASHDSLTQVANRRAVMGNLERSLARTHRGTSQLAVMFIDLDGFKGVNDLEGHAVGDEVLAAVARRLVNSVRQGDQVGRVGGDEFVVVAEPVSGVDDALQLAERIRDELETPIAAGQVSVSVGASIGIAMVDSDCDLSADELLRDADLAVYKAKSQGRSQIVVCDEELRAELEQRADLEHALRAAIANDELIVHYQPIVGSLGDETVGLEALVRWERPGTGLVPPDSFIPHAERTELIVDVDRWVLDAVAAQMRSWADHEILGRLPVAVNVSARTLGRADFVDGVLTALRAHDVAPDRLIIEVTESAVLHDMHHAGWALQTLRTHGVQVAIDDFGTGYTSLSHLRALPVDILKIDRSFTNDPSAASLVQLIIDTGHLLGARVTSEGIETDEQATTLSGMGSDELQGFLYGHPVPAALIELEMPLTTPPGRMAG